MWKYNPYQHMYGAGAGVEGSGWYDASGKYDPAFGPSGGPGSPGDTSLNTAFSFSSRFQTGAWDPSLLGNIAVWSFLNGDKVGTRVVPTGGHVEPSGNGFKLYDANGALIGYAQGDIKGGFVYKNLAGEVVGYEQYVREEVRWLDAEGNIIRIDAYPGQVLSADGTKFVLRPYTTGAQTSPGGEAAAPPGAAENSDALQFYYREGKLATLVYTVDHPVVTTPPLNDRGLAGVEGTSPLDRNTRPRPPPNKKDAESSMAPLPPPEPTSDLLPQETAQGASPGAAGVVSDAWTRGETGHEARVGALIAQLERDGTQSSTANPKQSISPTPPTPTLGEGADLSSFPAYYAYGGISPDPSPSEASRYPAYYGYGGAYQGPEAQRQAALADIGRENVAGRALSSEDARLLGAVLGSVDSNAALQEPSPAAATAPRAPISLICQ